jgi:NAD(P)-dependent dehydrogenase (short-subunit alcohol dehydrogenase family)
MKVIVITGSTRGIGYGLADSFLALDCAVTVSGRTQEAVDEAVAQLSSKHGADRVFGHPCDVTDFQQVQNLWKAAQAHFDKIDIWINNAGLSNPQMNFWELSAEKIKAVVSTNLTGAMYGTKVALNAMLEQGFGAVYNMEGLGSDDRKIEGLALYGSTKAGLRYFDECVAKETAGMPVLVGSIRPGMVITDLVTRPYEDRPPEEWEGARRIFNILADRVETVTPWLAQQVLTNEKNGACISWLSRRKVIGRFLMAPFRKRNLFE